MAIRTRRAFLGEAVFTGLAGSIVSGSSSVLAANPSRPRKMTIDLVFYAIGVKTQQVEAADLAHRHGFESVYANGRHLAKLSDQALEDLLGDMKQKGITWGTAGAPVEFRKDDAAFRADMKGLPAFAKTLQRAGVTRVGTWLIWGDDQMTYLQQMKTFGSRLREIAKVLNDHGLRFGLEYVGTKTKWSSARHPWVHTMAETRELISQINVPHTGLILDSWHWYHAGETVEDILALKNSDVVAVDLNDAPKGISKDQMVDNTRELPCATGVIPVGDFLNALNQIGYDGPVRAEPFNKPLNKLPTEEALKATAQAMKKAFALIK